MKIVVTWITVFAVLTFQILGFQISRSSLLSEDSNGNTLPDLVELQKGCQLHTSKIPKINTCAIIAIINTAIISVVIVITRKLATFKGLDYRKNFDFFAKIFKSKMRGWFNVRWFCTFCVLAVLLCGLVLVASAQKKGYDPFAEDPDGDGLPSVVEEQIGTDPLDAMDVAYLEDINYEDINESVEWVNVSRGAIVDLV